jgi:mRNA-degrading endonuclease HigB of HigAB toxin-antitoxin module
MDIIGRHLLPDFWRRHPESESALRGVAAIIAAATWHGDGDIRLQLGAAATPASEGRVLVTDPDGYFQLTMRVNYARHLIHILAIDEVPHE